MLAQDWRLAHRGSDTLGSPGGTYRRPRILATAGETADEGNMCNHPVRGEVGAGTWIRLAKQRRDLNAVFGRSTVLTATAYYQSLLSKHNRDGSIHST